MNAPHISTSGALSRRAFLRTTGVGLSLPFLEAMLPRFVRGAAAGPPRRMVLINKALGLHAPDFFPKKPGRDFELTPYLKSVRRPAWRFHGVQRTVASRSRRRALFGAEFPHRRAAFGHAGVPQHHLARSAHRRADRRADAASVPRVRLAQRQPFVDAQRRADPAGQGSRRRVSAAVHRRHAGRDARTGTAVARRPQHPRLGARGNCRAAAPRGRGRPGAARPIFHRRARCGAAPRKPRSPGRTNPSRRWRRSRRGIIPTAPTSSAA